MSEREKILDKHYKSKMHWKSVNRENVLNAMNEHAEKFGAWLRCQRPDVFYLHPSTKQLLDLYNSINNEQK